MQQRIAELTADAEENIVGIRVVKAFAQEERELASLPPRGRRGCSTRRSTRPGMQARYLPLIGFLPQLGIAAVLLVGGREVIHGSLSSARSSPSTSTC